jgi:hypothetical protein
MKHADRITWMMTFDVGDSHVVDDNARDLSLDMSEVCSETDGHLYVVRYVQ